MHTVVVGFVIMSNVPSWETNYSTHLEKKHHNTQHMIENELSKKEWMITWLMLLYRHFMILHIAKQLGEGDY